MQRAFTLGIEEELQIIDPTTGELRSLITELLGAQEPLAAVKLQRELHQSVVEVATDICPNIEAARDNVTRNRAEAARIAARIGMRIAAGSTHPFSRWQDQAISEDARYADIVEDLQDIARANLIFGLHVHVGIEDRAEAIAIYNSARHYLPHLLALSTSSPFFGGRKTGLQSTRALIFKRLPRTGIPEAFSSYQEFERLVTTLVRSGSIDDGRRIWWDLRPHPTFSTLEFRICDIPSRVDDVIAIAALVQAIVAKLAKLYEHNLILRPERSALVLENKWRAARYGVEGTFIDFQRERAEQTRDQVRALLGFVDDVVDSLDSREALRGIERILEEGTTADRQLAVYESTGGNLRAVLDLMLEETMLGVTAPVPLASAG